MHPRPPRSTRRRTVGAVLPVLALAALVIGACGSDDGASSTPVTDPDPPPTQPPATEPPADGAAPELDGREFLSTSVDGYQLVDGTQIQLTFDDGAVSANAGCNTLFGGYTIAEGRLQTEQLATTEMGCDMDRMAQDRWLTDILALEPFVELDGDTLTLRGAGGATLVLMDDES